MVKLSTYTLYPLLLNAWTISMQYLTIPFSSFSGEDFQKSYIFYIQTIFAVFSQCRCYHIINNTYSKDYLSLIFKNYVQ